MSKNTMIIGVAGASGSGKTKLANGLANQIRSELGGNLVSMIGEDAYYFDQSSIPFEQRELVNYDHPDALETELLSRHLQQLIDGVGVQVPQYDFSQHTRKSETTPIAPSRLIIVEGILLFHDAKIRELLDLKVYVDVAQEICLTRRLMRDIEERGRELSSVLNQYQNFVRPMFKEFVEPSRDMADLVVPHGGDNRKAIDVLSEFICARLRSQ